MTLLRLSLFSGLVDKAERSHQVSRLVRGQFVREFSEGFPMGGRL